MSGNLDMLETLIHTEVCNFDRTLSRDELRQLADDRCRMMSAVYPVTPAEFEILVKRLLEKIETNIGRSHTLLDEDTEHQFWYQAHKNDGFYWNRFRDYLIKVKKWSKEVVHRLNETTDDIMDYLGNPNSGKMFNRRGLLLGDVQSGKTATYTAICNKATDAGYRVIIVLAGITKSLRIQTQERLDAEFAGRDSLYALDVKAKDAGIKSKAVGVGKINPDNSKKITCFTSVKSDFNKRILESNDLNLQNLNGTALFVIKKNSRILNNLYLWLENSADSEGKIHLPLLLIDDEADNASVNTKDPDLDPTAINMAIRNILHSFSQSTYLGITATPFANIFIDPVTKDGPEDLFPRDFITVLPSPSNYIGAEEIFGYGNFDDKRNRLDVKYPSAIVRIDNEEMENYFKFGHRKDIIFSLHDIPKSLKRAICYFILATAVRDLRFDEKEHCSMLVNVTRYTDVQNKIRDLIEEYVRELRSDVADYGRCSIDEAMKIPHIQEFSEVWDEFGFEKLCGCSWETMLQDFLFDSLRRIEVSAVNQSTRDVGLNYYNYKDSGMRVIAVGGNSLSRGLTLEGLCVSYFYRNTKMYDTLLQMGRWFGYRPNYDDLFKIWMAEEAVDWYGFITDATRELKEELYQMEREHKTPNQFGLRVRQDPNSLIITARNKMRTGTVITVPITLSGRLIETPRLKNNQEVLDANEEACRSLIAKLDAIPGVNRTQNANPQAVLWTDVPKEHVMELVGKFESHPWNLNFNAKAISDYIKEKCESDVWDVAIPFGGVEADFEISECGLKIKPELRTVVADEKMLRISGTHVKVGSGSSTRIGLSDEKIKSINDSIDAQNKNRKGRERIPKNDRTYLIKDRKPILMIHIIKTQPSENAAVSDNLPPYIFALGIGFPHSGESEKTANYVVNLQDLRNWIDISDEEDI